MFGLGFQEILIIALIILLLFGGRKIPELMRGLGKGVRSFKEGINGIEKESESGNDNTKSSAKASSGNEKGNAPE